MSNIIKRIKEKSVNSFNKKLLAKCVRVVLLDDVLKILEDEKPKDTTKIFEELTIQAKMLGFNYVDLYIPDKQSDELVAFTFSKSEEYSKIIRDVEVCKVVVEHEKLRELADAIKKRPSWEWMKDNLDKLEDIEFSFRQIEQKFELLFDVESVKDTKKEKLKK